MVDHAELVTAPNVVDESDVLISRDELLSRLTSRNDIVGTIAWFKSIVMSCPPARRDRGYPDVIFAPGKEK